MARSRIELRRARAALARRIQPSLLVSLLLFAGLLVTAMGALTAPTPPPSPFRPFVTAVNNSQTFTSSGPTTGGFNMTISGTQFNTPSAPPATKVTFLSSTGATLQTFNPQGGAQGPFFTIDSPNQISIHGVPAVPDQVVDVQVTNSTGSSDLTPGDQFTFVAAQPMITGTGLSSNRGPASGGNQVTIVGSGFLFADKGGSVTVNGTTLPAKVDSDTHITIASMPAVTCPNSAASCGGLVVVKVPTQPDRNLASSASIDRCTTPGCDQYTFVTAPTVTAISPGRGPTTGGTVMHVTGTGFRGGLPAGNVSSVTFTDSTTPSGASASGTGISVQDDSHLTVTVPASPFPNSAPGSVDVQVTTDGGASATNSADVFTYVTPPSIARVSPTSGPDAGGTAVTITGTGFFGGTTGCNVSAVMFGSAAGSIAPNPVQGPPSCTDGTLKVISPAAAAQDAGKTVDIAVVTDGGSTPSGAADKFTYHSAPTVTSASPNRGSTDGGGPVVKITGAGFESGSSVSFVDPSNSVNHSDVAAKDTNFISPTEIDVVLPPSPLLPNRAAGPVDITVTTPSFGQSGTGSKIFSYVSPPLVTNLDHHAGPAAGGTTVKVSGSGFLGVTGPAGVRFGGVNATSYSVDSDIQITAVSPAHPAATVDVTVVRDGISSSAGPTDTFTFIAPVPVVSAVSPGAGPVGGGTAVTITGTGFTGATSVNFGTPSAPTNAVSSLTVVDDQHITTTSPQDAKPTGGPELVTVTTAGGTSTASGDNCATAGCDMFTYAPVPTISSITPNFGPVATSNPGVTIKGNGFFGGGKASDVSGVTFGGVAASAVVVGSDTQLTVTAPASGLSGDGSGAVLVVVTTNTGGSSTQAHDACGTCDQYTYVARPTVTSLSPSFGKTAGGDAVTITGTNFNGSNGTGPVTRVLFGSTPVAVSANNISPDGKTIAITSPAQGAENQQVDVTVVSGGGTSAANPPGDTWSWVANPTVTGVAPAAGPVQGGNTVTVSGTNLNGAGGKGAVNVVKFGTVAANPQTIVIAADGSSLTVTAPAHGSNDPNLVDIVVQNALGTASSTSSADRYDYALPPAVTSVSPTYGKARGGDTVTITGNNFNDASGLAPASGVMFGTAGPVKPATVSADGTTITVVSPPRAAADNGKVDVRVITPGGTSPAVACSPQSANPCDSYIYVPTPTVTALSPSYTGSAGGGTMTVTGTGFRGFKAQQQGPLDVGPATAVTFGSGPGAVTAADFVLIDDTHITVTIPAQGALPSSVDVYVTSGGGQSPQAPGDVFSYVPPPTVTGLNPATGGPQGGNFIIISGTGFNGVNGHGGASLVTFGTGPTAAVSSSVEYIAQDGTLRVQVPARGNNPAQVDVFVTNGGGTSAVNRPGDLFNYIPSPTVTGLSPTSGKAVGGDTLRISGTNFNGVNGTGAASSVTFGSGSSAVTVSSITINPDGTITVQTPAQGANPSVVDVFVNSGGGRSPQTNADRFTYIPAPTVAGISPNSGPASGGTQVSVTGTGFLNGNGLSVKIGGVPATSVAFVDAQHLTAAAPPGSAGPADVAVTNPDGQSGTLAAGFTYIAPPVVTAVSPAVGTTDGGTAITITGSGFQNGAGLRVNVAGAPATAVAFTDAQHLTAITPAGAAGPADIQVVNPDGQQGTGRALFTYVAGEYHPVVPVRILDTRGSSRVGTCPSGCHAVEGGAPMDVQVSGISGIPNDGSVSAVIMNVTAVGATQGGYITVYPAGSAQPTASNLNFPAGAVVPNLVEVPLGTSGRVTVFNATGSVDVLFDVAGYYSKTINGTAGLYRPLAPARLMDTRSGSGTCGGTAHCVTVGPGSSIDLQVLNANDTVTGQPSGVPASGVSAVVLNATVTGGSAGSFLSLYPSGGSRPTVSNLNFGPGQTVPNRVVVKVGDNGRVSIYNDQGSVDVIIDVSGYYTDASASDSIGSYTPLNPARLVDTRSGSGNCGAGSCTTIPAGGHVTLSVAGASDITSGLASGVPASGARAVVLNVTVTGPTAGSFLSVYPGVTRPSASDLNFGPGQTIANLVVAKLAPDGTVTIYNDQGAADVVVDVEGWFS